MLSNGCGGIHTVIKNRRVEGSRKLGIRPHGWVEASCTACLWDMLSGRIKSTGGGFATITFMSLLGSVDRLVEYFSSMGRRLVVRRCRLIIDEGIVGNERRCR